MKRVRFAYPVGACLVLVYTVFLALFSHAGFPQTMFANTHMPFLSDRPVGEDGYYMLEVAWNLAAGKGVVGSDGQAVTGIQPLSTLLFAVIAKVVQICGGGKWAFVRAIIVFGGLNLIIFALLIGKIARVISKEWEDHGLVFALGSSLALFNFWLFSVFTYGLETGVYVTLLAALLLFTLTRLPSAKTADIIAIGVLAGLCGWARIDFGLVFFVFLVMALSWRLMSLKQVLLSGLVALALISPWFIWVYAESGTMMPSSGPAESELINVASVRSRLEIMANVLVEHLTPWSYSASATPGLNGRTGIDVGMVFSIFLLVVLLGRLKSLKHVLLFGLLALALISPWFFWVYAKTVRTVTPGSGPIQSPLTFSDLMRPVKWLELASLAILAVLARYKRINVITNIGPSLVYVAWCLAVVPLVPVYVVFFGAAHFYGRYTAPLHCVVLPFLAVVLSALLAKMKGGGIMAQAFLLALIVSFALFAGGLLHMGLIGRNAHSISAGFIQRYFDQSAHIGAFQSGVIGYFNDNVINLDGKVNSQALNALKTNTLEQYIDTTHIDVLIDWPDEYIHRYLPEQWLSGWRFCARQPANASVCLARSGADKR